MTSIKMTRQQPIFMTLIALLVLAGAINLVTSINPNEALSATDKIEKIFSDPMQVPFSMLSELVVPDTYAEWRKDSHVMDSIASVSGSFISVLLICLLGLALNEFRLHKDYEALSHFLGALSLLPTLVLYSHIVSYFVFGNLLDVVFLFLLLPVGALVFPLPALLMHMFGLVSRSHVQTCFAKAWEVVVPSKEVLDLIE